MGTEDGKLDLLTTALRFDTERRHLEVRRVSYIVLGDTRDLRHVAATPSDNEASIKRETWSCALKSEPVVIFTVWLLTSSLDPFFVIKTPMSRLCFY